MLLGKAKLLANVVAAALAPCRRLAGRTGQRHAVGPQRELLGTEHRQRNPLGGRREHFQIQTLGIGQLPQDRAAITGPVDRHGLDRHALRRLLLLESSGQ
jgi:hypothetical protein